MININKNIVCCIVVVLFSTVAFAGTTDIAPVYRGVSNSLHVIYESPDAGVWNRTVFEEGAEPTYPLFNFPDFFLEDPTGNPIVYSIGLPNYLDNEPVKLIRLQLSFNFEVSSEEISMDIYGGDSPFPNGVIVGGSPSGSATHHYFDIEIRPNPDFEHIDIYWTQDGAAGGASLGDPTRLCQVEIDTISIPEPATMSLLALGGLAMIRRRFA